MRKLLAILAGALMLAAVNVTIYQREHLLEHGQVVLLELAPVDPRSLMQGDYMALNFAIANQAFRSGMDRQVKDGHIVAALDQQGVARFVRFANGTPLAANELLLRYRVRDDRIKFATNAFFFQEGHATVYEAAKFGEFRVSKDGDMILTHMRDAKRQRLHAS
jgi:uncharacterized membrane-anchored protein